MPARAPPSLKMQAIGFLSRREYSRQELRIKLLSALRRRERAAQDAAAGTDGEHGLGTGAKGSPLRSPVGEHESDLAPDAERDPEREVDELLDWLQAHAYLSDARFVESRVNARAARQGLARIRQELAGHGVALPSEQAVALRETEFARAQAVWQRKFGAPAADARGRAAQARFLVARGFAAEVVRRIVGGQDEF